ncbi:MAG: putative signal transducing protein [Chlamydiales bacterium]
MNDFVLAGVYESRFDADLIKTYLGEAGIEAIIQADDAGGTMPYLSFSNGVKIFVPKSDLEEATIIMQQHKGIE